MRILHTSDLHLGRSFHGRSLLEDQEQLNEEIFRTARELQADAVLVSGDVYDQASPRTEVIAQLSRLLTRCAQSGIPVVLTSGNHDSAARLGFAGPLLEQAGVHMITSLEQIGVPVCVGEELLVYGIPYLDPRSAAATLGTEPTHQAVLGEAMARIREDRAGRPQPRAVVMAHCFASGAAGTDSERILDTGGLGVVPADLFSGMDYAALGHLHRRQSVAPTVRYSGSPLAFSFSEAGQRKGCWIVDLPAQPAEPVRATEHLWEHQLDLARLEGTLEQLLTEPEHAWAEDCLCQITLTDEHRPAHPMERLRQRFPQTLELKFSGLSSRHRGDYGSRRAQARDEEQLCEDFFASVRHRPLEPEEQSEVNGVLVEARRRLGPGGAA